MLCECESGIKVGFLEKGQDTLKSILTKNCWVKIQVSFDATPLKCMPPPQQGI